MSKPIVFRPVLVLVCLAGLSNALHAENTAGSFLEVDRAKFHHEHLTELTWQARITEYQYNADAPSGFRLRIEFNSVNFMGSNGTKFHSVGAMIQNVGHTFADDVVGIPGSTIMSFSALGLYLSSLDSTWADSQHGVKLLADPGTWPQFGRVFEDIDNQGFIGKNIYTRQNVGAPSQSSPVIIRWTVTRLATVVDPREDLSRNVNGNWVPLKGTFVIWQFKIEINGTVFTVVDYYLPIEFAEYICAWDPLSLGQEYFGAKEQILDQQKGTVQYSDIRAFDGVSWHYLDNWKIVSRIDDGGGNLENRFGWKSDDVSLTSCVGHAADATECFRDPGKSFAVRMECHARAGGTGSSCTDDNDLLSTLILIKQLIDKNGQTSP